MILQAALFDLDGVLIDSEGIYYDFWAEVESLYPTGIPDFAAYIKGSTLVKIMDYFTDETVKADIIRRLEEQERTMVYRPYEAVMPFLDRLRAHNVPCAIVTSSNARKMQKLFAQNPGFDKYFDVVITDRDVTRSKPDPQGYLLAAERLGVDACKCVVFEDSYAGLEAGRRSGAKVIALATTNKKETLTDKADRIVEGFEELTIESLLSIF